MKIWLPIFVLFCTVAIAQPDTRNNRLSIPPVIAPETKAPVVAPPKKDPYYVPPSISGEPSKSYNLDTDTPINFGAPKPKLRNPGDGIAEKMNMEGNKGKSYPELRQNQHLGEFRVKSKLISIMYQDVGVVDGDHISVYINGRLIRDIGVDGRKESVEIPLDKGFNKVTIKVTDTGRLWPSTIHYEITDDKGKLITASSDWSADIGIVTDMVIFNENED